MKKWPYYVLLVRDYYSRKGRQGRKGRLVIGDWERIAHAKVGKGDWLLEIGERVAHVAHARRCVKVVLSVEVRAQAFSERPLPQLRDTLTRGFWIGKSKQGGGRIRA